MAGIVLERVSRRYSNGVLAVDAIDLEVNDKEFLVLLGPSGCGKTSTLRMIAGLEEISSGEIRIGGRRVNDVPAKDRDIAMVFQNYALYPHMTARRNMGFALELRRGVGRWRQMLWRAVRSKRAASLAASRREIDAEVERTARLLGIEGLLERLPRELSGGERQRVALGRAIVRRPAAFLFDEPLSNLDARLRVGMRRELKELHRRLSTTMVYVTHDQVEALTLGDRIVVMNRGVIQQVGAPMELYDRPRNRFVAGFLGSPPMNFFAGSVESAAAVVGEAGGEGLWLRTPEGDRLIRLGPELSTRVKSLGLRRCVLGARPEDVRLKSAAHDGWERPAGESGAQAVGTVHVVESLGDATLVSVLVGHERSGKIGGEGERAGDGGAAKRGDLQSDSKLVASDSEMVASDSEMFAGDNKMVIVKTDARTSFRGGERVQVEFAPERTHVFDADTGLSLANASVESMAEQAIVRRA